MPLPPELEQSSFNSRPPFPASMLSIRIASVLFICCFEVSNYPIFHSWPVCYLYVLPVCYLYVFRSFEPPNLPFLASMLSIRIASMLFTCCFEASNHPIFHSWPVCYLYVLPVCYLHAASKLRTTQSSIPGQYAIYTYCQYAIYMLFRSFEPLNLPFPASMLSIRIASVLFICCFEASNHRIFHSRPVCYLYVLPVCYLHAVSKLRTTQSSIPGQYAIYMYCQYAIYMLLRTTQSSIPGYMISIRIASTHFTCCFKASNHPIFHSRRVCYLYFLPVCYLYAASKLRTTQSSIPGQYAIYTYCQYAIYMLLRTTQSSIPGQYAIYTYCQYAIYMLLRTTQSSIPGQYAIYTYCQYAIYMLLRSFEPPNLLFPASMLSIRIASMLFICCFEASNHPIFYSRPVCYLYVLPVCYLHAASNHPIFHSWPVCYLYVLPVCYLHAASNHPIFHSWPVCYLYVLPVCYLHAASNHPIFHSWPVCCLYVLPVCYLYAASKLRTTQSSIPGQYAIYAYCQYAIYMLLRNFEPPNLPFSASMLSIRIASMLFACCFEPPNLPFLASMLSIRIASMLFTCCFETSNHPIFHSQPVCYLYVLPVCYLHAASNHPIFHSWQVCYLYVLPVCYLHAASKLRTTQSSIPEDWSI